MEKNSTEFHCHCGVMKGWIEDGQESKACPHCGAVYRGEEREKKNGCIAITAWTSTPPHVAGDYLYRGKPGGKIKKAAVQYGTNWTMEQRTGWLPLYFPMPGRGQWAKGQI